MIKSHKTDGLLLSLLPYKIVYVVCIPPQVFVCIPYCALSINKGKEAEEFVYASSSFLKCFQLQYKMHVEKREVGEALKMGVNFFIPRWRAISRF